MVAHGEADAAAIDSNVLRLHAAPELRVVESWGPFPIQPAIIRIALAAETKARVNDALLTMHERHGDALQRFGVARFVAGDERIYR
jgi:ABC-type phosphate/phosphonate transport system substrate-binding protein